MSLLDGVTATNDPKPRCADCGQYVEDHKLGLNVHIRGLKQPEDGCTGCVVAMKCPECNRVEIQWSEHAPKPTDGGIFWVLGLPCYYHTSTIFCIAPQFIPSFGKSCGFSIDYVQLGEVSNG